MATKANMQAYARVKDAERRAKRKLQRLKRKNIRTGSIEPFENIDASDTRAMNSYAKRLEKFISRQNRYVGGVEGTPIKYSDFKKLKNLEKAYNKKHHEFWEEWGGKPLITSFGKEDETLGHYSWVSPIQGIQFGNILGEKNTPPSKLKGKPDIDKRIEIMQRELSPAYQKKRLKQLRKNLLESVDLFNNPKLSKMIRTLSDDRLLALQRQTNFVPLYFRFLSTNNGTYEDLKADEYEQSAQIEHLEMTLENVNKEYPLKRKNTKGKKKPKRAK